MEKNIEHALNYSHYIYQSYYKKVELIINVNKKAQSIIDGILKCTELCSMPRIPEYCELLYKREEEDSSHTTELTISFDYNTQDIKFLFKITHEYIKPKVKTRKLYKDWYQNEFMWSSLSDFQKLWADKYLDKFGENMIERFKRNKVTEFIHEPGNIPFSFGPANLPARF